MGALSTLLDAERRRGPFNCIGSRMSLPASLTRKEGSGGDTGNDDANVCCALKREIWGGLSTWETGHSDDCIERWGLGGRAPPLVHGKQSGKQDGPTTCLNCGVWKRVVSRDGRFTVVLCCIVLCNIGERRSGGRQAPRCGGRDSWIMDPEVDRLQLPRCQREASPFFLFFILFERK